MTRKCHYYKYTDKCTNSSCLDVVRQCSTRNERCYSLYRRESNGTFKVYDVALGIFVCLSFDGLFVCLFVC